ncbi:MAG: PKD domain-containing protein [Sphingobacteriales bacterium]|nr:PKD domain-containing protein [Sphingobacteriales bacterium]
MKKIYSLLAALIMLQFSLTAQTNTNPCAGLAKFTYNITGNTVKFTSAPNANISFHYWKLGDGATSNDANPSHIYANGSYRVVHYIKDTVHQCYDSAVAEFIIQSIINPCAGLAKFTYSITGNTVKFTSATNSNINFHYWKLGDGATSNDANPSHTYANGSYRVVHYIKDTIHQCYDSAVAEFRIQDTVNCPKPSFQWKRDSLNKRSITFYNTTGPLPTIYKFTWQFGDGASSTDPNPTHVYADTGVYNACLIIEQLNGQCKNYSCQTIIIRPLCDIKPDFTWESTALNPLKIYFKNISAPTTSPNVSFSWSFGDGTFSNDVSPQHLYTKPGAYQVCLKMQVTNTDCIKYICKQVIIDTPCDNLYAKFEWKQDSVHPLRGVQFINLSSPLFNTTQSGVRWNFGDGTTSSEWSPFHQYNEPGNYKVCLTIKYADSCYKETCNTVVVSRPDINCEEISKFRFERITNDSLGFYFVAKYRNPNWKYIWTFGDGQGMLGSEAKHRYEKPGKYTVCLTVYKSDNCASTTCMELTAGNIACTDVQFKFEYIKGYDVPNRIKFHAVSNAPLGSVKWLVYNTNSSSQTPVILYGIDPTYTFNQIGLYKVCAVGYTTTGCYKQYCDTLRIDKIVTPPTCELKIYPNPASSYIEFDVQAETSGSLILNIFDITGVKHMQLQVAAQQGNNHIRIPVELLSAGYYTIEILQSNGRVCKGKFQKI